MLNQILNNGRILHEPTYFQANFVADLQLRGVACSCCQLNCCHELSQGGHTASVPVTYEQHCFSNTESYDVSTFDAVCSLAQIAGQIDGLHIQENACCFLHHA